ncbi:chitobiosyldiphosphodolichol beta-1,4 mannosyltransferase [Pneumocystis jirovecii RU7]|uniref:Chitobiosyldiphosphodolichol beta-mannosyltransferase n=1 Tax=Pneumocystis jirovecii (strain RU7) TaxID=1408657 RepID=A0A0W4ZQ01_PNEJ7|nr:chitobiosyldiphosphodolichol beta-1,4 mannosyltransferase [Pneumocystis jirovecii RU7]KTW30457.1 hypothetical protein T551_01740 [Pneumocystis jirovecii RU7]
MSVGWGIAIISVCIFFAGFKFQQRQKSRFNDKKRKSKRSVCLVVLGDIGRSPRMQYHALSLAQHGFEVDLVGYRANSGSFVFPDVDKSKNIRIKYVTLPPKFLETHSLWLFFLTGTIKAFFQAFFLFFILIYSTHSFEYLIVQNPPSIPSFVVTRLVCLIRSTKLIIDWHNLGYSVLSLKLGPNHILVKFHKWYERVFGNSADIHFSVSYAMTSFLREKWNYKSPIHTLYDRPPMHFKPLDNLEKSSFLSTFVHTYDFDISNEKTKLLVSSTSWTIDEDFSILLEAFIAFDKANIILSKDFEPPSILAIITGRGPLRKFYEQKIKSLNLKYVKIVTIWLDAKDYPRFIASADLGICLHTSSSGLDLPMKIVDMFGCGIPVCAIEFPALTELVKDGKNGIIFNSSAQLADSLKRLFHSHEELKKLKEGAMKESQYRWHNEWDAKIAPLFTKPHHISNNAS